MTDIFDVIKEKQVVIPTNISGNLRNLLTSLLEKDPAKRIKLPDIKSNAWLTDNDTVKFEAVRQIIKREDLTDTEVEAAFSSRSKTMMMVCRTHGNVILFYVIYFYPVISLSLLF